MKRIFLVAVAWLGLSIAAVAQTNSGGGATGGVSPISTTCGVAGGPVSSGSMTIAGGDFDNPISTTTDTISNSQCGKTNRYTGASATTTVPASTGFSANFTIDYKCEASGGCTLVPSGTTINGSSGNITVANGNSLELYLDTQATPVWHTKPGNPTSIPLSGVTGLGTGVGTALGNALSSAGGVSSTIASGTAALGTSAVSAGACGTATTVSAPNVATTDVISVGFGTDPTATTGYLPTAMLTIVPYPTAGNVNFKQCNLTGSSITPAALTINWSVKR